MHAELINMILDIQSQKKSGLLMATAESRQPGSDIAGGPETGHFSFFFKEGHLATVLCRGMGVGLAISRVPSIGKVTKTQWTSTNPGTITISDDQVGTDRLLELLGASKTAIAEADVRRNEATSATASALESRTQKVFLKVMGGAGESCLDGIRAKFNPKDDPEGFTAACVAELQLIVGLKTAQSLLQK